MTQRRSRPTADQQKALDAGAAALYATGLSIRAIATAQARSYGGVRASLIRSGVRLRSRTDQTRTVTDRAPG